MESARTARPRTLRAQLKHMVPDYRLEALVDIDPKYPSKKIRVEKDGALQIFMSTCILDYLPNMPSLSKHDQTKNIDDVIIYRCLMMILLCCTRQPHSSKILDSGL